MKETLEDFMKQLHQNHTSFEELAHWHHDLEKECANLKEKNEKMLEVLRIIWDADALQQWAWEDPDDEGSIADLVREVVRGK